MYISAHWITAALLAVVIVWLVRVWRASGGSQACLAGAAACAALVGAVWLLAGSTAAIVTGVALIVLLFFDAAFELLENLAA
jgi:hypothetical protein